MRVYDSLNDSQKVHFSDRITESDTQAELYARLKKDGFTVKSAVGVAQKRSLGGVSFDLVVFKDKTAVAIIEVKSTTKGPEEDLDATMQGLKYRSFGIPVVLFWDMSFYDDLKTFLSSKKTKNVDLVKNTFNSGALKDLYKSLDITSMRAFDLRHHSQEFQELERLLEEKRDRVKSIMDEANSTLPNSQQE